MTGKPPRTTHALRWAEPPPPARRGKAAAAFFDAAVAELKARPGAWAVVAETTSRGFSSGQRDVYTRRGCEVTQRTNGEGFVLYARWPKAKRRARG